MNWREGGQLGCVTVAVFKEKRTTAPEGYWRASAMWSEESFLGRESRAERKALQKVVSDMVGCRGSSWRAMLFPDCE